jgi:hypothetical protein
MNCDFGFGYDFNTASVTGGKSQAFARQVSHT